MNIICPICEGEKRKSIVRIGTAPIPDGGPADEYWDEDGDLHRHDPNSTGQSYECSNGHIFYPPGNPCPTCGHKWEKDKGKQIAFARAKKSKAEVTDVSQ